ncbi:MAG: hypothetical protein JNK85_16425 [Verrucomicrobiales bacterium]|nr:hypothetical protein [Verrucomicrobiales bacterium]
MNTPFRQRTILWHLVRLTPSSPPDTSVTCLEAPHHPSLLWRLNDPVPAAMSKPAIMFRVSTIAFALSLCLAGDGSSTAAATESAVRRSLVFSNATARLVADLDGGAIGDFRRVGNPVNPLHWGTPTAGDTAIRGFGHFLCLDRWGPPSEAEGARGMPYHGEASHVAWQPGGEVSPRAGALEATMSAKLPIAGLAIQRRIRFSVSDPVFAVREVITNENPLGRLYNCVQHPTIGPPFLDTRTLVDCNGRRGFAQGGSLPHPEEPSSYWPRALTKDGESVDLRRLLDDPEPNVVTYAIDQPYGWVTAISPSTRLLLGYFWKTSDYPWISLWRDVRDGAPAARGLEFGTTGLHQPFPILTKKGRIWDRPLAEHLDSGQAVGKEYIAFLLEIPPDFRGVEDVVLQGNQLTVRERSAEGPPRELRLSIEHLLVP